MAADDDQTHSDPPPSRWRRALPWLMLLGLTAYAAFARFFWIDRPTLWIDEYATYFRTAGSFEHLLEQMQRDGFVPLHYFTYWWLAQQVTMTPFWLRLIPALAGTLFVPAMFLLARQLFNRKVALFAAALASASAWSMTYSRDAKMYMHTWLFATLGVALLMLWLRQRGWRQWPIVPLWIICGALSVWLHATALIVIAIYPVCVLVRLPRVRWYQPLVLLVGLAAILGGPWWYYTQFNKYIARSGIVAVETRAEEEERESWGHSGLTWIARHNHGQSPAQLTLNSATSYLAGAQWPRDGSQDPPPNGPPPSDWYKLTASVVMSVVIGWLVLGMLPWPRSWRMDTGHRIADPPGRFTTPRRAPTAEAAAHNTKPCADIMRRGSGWRSAMLLAIWIGVPTYGFYCRSFESFSAPWDWLGAAWSAMGWGWLYVLAGAVVVGALSVAWRGVPAVAAAGVGLALAGVIGLGTHEGGATWLWPAAERLLKPWVLGPVAALAVGAGWHAAGDSPGQRLRALGWLALLIAAMFVVLSGAYLLASFLHERAVEKGTHRPWESIWMPRYLGVIFPAVMVAAAALLARVPTRTLRTLAIATILGVNLTQGWARILADTQPPYDRLAADMIAGRAEDATTRTILNIPGNGGHRRTWYNRQYVAYYLAIQTGHETGERGLDVRDVLREYWASTDMAPDALREALDRYPEVRQLVVWEAFDHETDEDALDGADPYLDALGSDWSLVEMERIAHRQFWNWRWLGWYRRRVYQKTEPESPPAPTATEQAAEETSQ